MRNYLLEVCKTGTAFQVILSGEEGVVASGMTGVKTN